MPAHRTVDQGKMVIERDNGGFLIMSPDGDVCWQPSKQFAESWAKQWFRDHLNADVGVGKIEWRG